MLNLAYCLGTIVVTKYNIDPMISNIYKIIFCVLIEMFCSKFKNKTTVIFVWFFIFTENNSVQSCLGLS